MNSGRTIFAQLLESIFPCTSTTVCAYVLVAIVKKRLNLDMSLYTILQILSVSLFEKTPILRALSNPPRQFREGVNHNLLELFNI